LIPLKQQGVDFFLRGDSQLAVKRVKAGGQAVLLQGLQVELQLRAFTPDVKAGARKGSKHDEPRHDALLQE